MLYQKCISQSALNYFQNNNKHRESPPKMNAFASPVNKHKRRANFSKSETQVLVEAYQERQTILEGKLSGELTQKKKDELSQKIGPEMTLESRHRHSKKALKY